MYHQVGRISGKKPLKTGVSTKGEWKILVFSITKRYDRQTVHLWFTAKGKKADLVSKLRMNDKVELEFYPNHSLKGDHVFTENIVKEIHLAAKMPNWDDTNEEEEPEVDFKDEMNLQKVADKQVKHYNG